MYKFPKGSADFKEIRMEGYVYIDKTKYIELLENSGNKSVHFFRPRRFGKSLFTSMLECYYDYNMADNFDNLFQGTYIHEHPTTKKNQYYVLKFNFSGFGNIRGEELLTDFNMKVCDALIGFKEYYNLKVPVLENVSAVRSLSRFLVQIRSQLKGRKLYIIIDEYDYFANDLLSFSFDEFTNAIRSDGFIRAFYEELKNATEGIIEKIFITGVSPITLNSMTSGYNISTNLSLDSDFNEMLGFTTDEMKYLISLIEGIEYPEMILNKMKQTYDGYIFSKDAEKHLYNPNMALYYLDYYQRKGKEPDSLIDPNIYSDYNKINNLLDIKPNKEQNNALLEIITNGTIACQLTLSYNLQKDFSKNDFISLLFYLGYLTIQDSVYDELILKVPNDVIRSVYFDYFNEMLKKKYMVYTDDYAEAVKQILSEQKNDKLITCAERTLASLDNRDSMKFDEKVIKVILTSILIPTSHMLVKNEYPVENGYIDLALFPKDNRKPIILVELKYIKTSDFNEQLLHVKRKEAFRQLQNYRSAKEFEGKDIMQWILIFSKDKCVLNEIID